MNTPDYIVLGSGVAGLRAAVELAREGQVAVLTKDRLDESNTEYAQGGVAVAMSDDDEISLHYEDTLKAGAPAPDPPAADATSIRRIPPFSGAGNRCHSSRSPSTTAIA